MLYNPFTPSEIASAPDDFFGRTEELKTLERSLAIGSVAIQGAIGIGKSSLLARTRLLVEGFGNDRKSRSVVAVGNRDLTTIDDISRKILENLVSIDEKQKKTKFKILNILEVESAEISKYYSDGRHLSVLQRIVEKDYLRNLVNDKGWLVIAIDEADKCPIAIARFFRTLCTHTQQQGIKNVRFILCGVHPFVQQMVEEDPGVSRFIYKRLDLLPLPDDEADELLEAKLKLVAKSASEQKIDLTIDPDIIPRIRKLSGGHPHIIQLLGSHIVEQECEDPDGRIDSRDLLPALSKVCYEDRAGVYDATIHLLELHNVMEIFTQLISRMERGFPSRISRKVALRITGRDEIEWLVKYNILSVQEDDSYSLVDEFLRIRMILDQDERSGEGGLERHLLTLGSIHQGYRHSFYGDDDYEPIYE